MNVFKYFWALVTTLFDSAGDNTEIKAALLLLILVGFIIGFAVGLVVASLARKKPRS